LDDGVVGRQSSMRIRSILVYGALIALVASLALAGPAFAQAKADSTASAKYVGIAKCKICHMGEARGKVYETWLATPHAKAFENLGAENQKNEACLGCHTTGHGKTLAAGATAADLQGVQCEACHGPGSDYKAMAVMKNRDEAIKKGLVMPTEKNCLECHGGPFPEGHKEVPKFDFATMVKKIEHHSKTAATPK
jgi:hypothetical protein